MHICVSLPDPSLAQALAAKEWCYKGSFVNEASRLMVEGPGTAFLFRRVRPQNCMKTSCFWKDVCILLLQVRFLAESLSLKPRRDPFCIGVVSMLFQLPVISRSEDGLLLSQHGWSSEDLQTEPGL